MKFIKFDVTDKQYDIITTNAEYAGMDTPKYIRTMLLSHRRVRKNLIMAFVIGAIIGILLVLGGAWIGGFEFKRGRDAAMLYTLSIIISVLSGMVGIMFWDSVQEHNE